MSIEERSTSVAEIHKQDETSKTQEADPGNSKENIIALGTEQAVALCDLNSTDCWKEMSLYPKNTLKPQVDAQHEVISVSVDHRSNVKAQGTGCGSELQENSYREIAINSFESNKPKYQGDIPDSLESTNVYPNKNIKIDEAEHGHEGCDVKSSMEGDRIAKNKLKPQEDASELEATNIDETEGNAAQGTAHSLELQDSIDNEKERGALSKPKLQETASEEVKSTCTDQTESGIPLEVGPDLKVQHSTDREKKRELCRENEFKSQGDVSDEVKSANSAKKRRSETKEKIVKDKLSVERFKNRTLTADEARDRRVKYKVKHARIQVLTLGDSLEAYLPSLKKLISERKYRHCDLICKLDKLKPCAPTDATYSKCIFLIDLDEQTGKPILGIFTDGKVQKNWEGRHLYHSSILEAAEVLEKLISASEWEVGRGNKGFWRKLHICCNKSGELVLWLLVQSPEEKSKEVIQKLKTLFTEFFKKGEGKQCKIASVYAQVTFTSASASSDRRISSLTELIMGSEQYEDTILGFKLRMTPRIPTLWGMEKSSMVCEVVKDLVALDDHTTVIIVGITDSGLLALTLAKDAGEVICVDKVPIIEDVKQNVRLNKLGSKCKFYAGFAIEELRKITPKYKKVHAVIMVPTVAKLMAFKERKNLSCVKSIIIFLESSDVTSAPLMALGDTERGMSFFPSRIIPFDTHPDDKDYMMAIRTEQVDARYKSSSRRSSGSSRSEDNRGRNNRTWHSKTRSAAERRERNRMLPDAREVIVARRYNKEKEQLMSSSRFRADDHPNLVIEVKKPNLYNDEQRRYVKERTKEADDYRYKVVEERNLCARAKQKVEDVLIDSLSRRLPSLDENTATKLKEVIAEAIVGAGLVDSSHQKKEYPLTPPEDVDYRSEHHLKYLQSNDIDTHISQFNDGIRRNEVTEYGYVDGNFQRQNIEDNCDRTLANRISQDYPYIGREAMWKRELLSDRRSVHIDTCDTFDRQNIEDSYDRTLANRTSHDYPSIGREAIRKRELLSDGRSVHIDTRDTFDRQNIEDRYDRTLANRTSHDYPNIGREAVRKRELLSDGRSVQIDSCETFGRINNYCDQQNIDKSDTYRGIEALSSRKRGLEIDHCANDCTEKKRRSQDHNAYEDRYASSLSSSNLEVVPYCNTQQHTNTFSRYVVSKDSDRRSPEAHNYATEQDSDGRDITNPVTKTPVSTKDLRHTAEKHSMLPEVSFSLFPSGSAAQLGPRPRFQHMYRHLLPESTLSNAVHPVTPVQGNINVPELSNTEFRRPPPYRPFMPPRERNK